MANPAGKHHITIRPVLANRIWLMRRVTSSLRHAQTGNISIGVSSSIACPTETDEEGRQPAHEQISPNGRCPPRAEKPASHSARCSSSSDMLRLPRSQQQGTPSVLRDQSEMQAGGIHIQAISHPDSLHSQTLEIDSGRTRPELKADTTKTVNVTSVLAQPSIRECRASRHPERTHEAANDHSHP
jgi:hypothetical protein